jgi:hypothetical protein
VPACVQTKGMQGRSEEGVSIDRQRQAGLTGVRHASSSSKQQQQRSTHALWAVCTQPEGLQGGGGAHPHRLSRIQGGSSCGTPSAS